MAPVAPPPDQTSGVLQKLSLDSQPNTEDVADPAGQLPAGRNGSSNGEAPGVSISSGRSSTPVLPEYVDPSNYYVAPGYAPQPYYYGGYDHAVNEWGDYSSYTNHDGTQGVYGDFYQGYGYIPYTAYSSNGSASPTVGHDGDLYGQQQYQYPAPFFKPHTPTRTTQGEASTSNAAEQSSISVVSAKNSNGASNANANGNDGTGTMKSNHQNSSSTLGTAQWKGGMRGGYHSTSYRDPRFGYDGMWSPVTWFDGSLYTSGQHKPARTSPLSSSSVHNSNNSASKNQNQQPVPHFMGMHAPQPTSGTAPGLSGRMYPANRFYSGSGVKNGFAYGYWGMPTDGKYKPRVQGNGLCCFGNESQDGLTEMNRGPRAGHFKNSKAAGPTSMIPVKNQNLSSVGNEHSKVPLDREQCNREDFSDKYSDAKFFIIKSYSEDDIHKSIKYNVWASTPNGNKKLDAGYQEAQEKAGGCPVFLFFSVNASGQFVGVAEMIGPVDFNKTVDYWQQDKWIGCFPVKWHIIKDVPNNILKHITLENNDNKPVTNSRDTQEVKLEQGLQMLKIFKEHVNKTSVLDDFDFYENRQNAMQEKRAKQKLEKQAWGGKTSHPAVDGEKEAASQTAKLQSASVSNVEAAQDSRSELRNPSEEAAAVPSDASKVIANGVDAGAVAGDASKVTANGVEYGVANGP